MALYNFNDLKSKYGGFKRPVAVVSVNNVNIDTNKIGAGIRDIEVDLTSGYEASIATFCIHNCFLMNTSKFDFEGIKKFIQLGSGVTISLGYESIAREVFLGVITRVNFIYEQQLEPYIKVTAMDVKGIMMSNHYARSLKATSYGDAVKEILSQSAYEKLTAENIIRKLEVTDTPDKKGGEGDSKEAVKTIDMVSESDYEFVVKSAKRFHYEFFTDCGTVYFRSAKMDKDIQMELSPKNGLLDFDIGYDITGLTQEIEVRGMDPGKGTAVYARKKLNNKISTGNKVRGILNGSRKVYMDSTITAKEDAQIRVDYLAEEMSYRFASLNCKAAGIPELSPGRFVEISDINAPLKNEFYITGVRHCYSVLSGYQTFLYGRGMTIGE